MTLMKQLTERFIPERSHPPQGSVNEQRSCLGDKAIQIRTRANDRNLGIHVIIANTVRNLQQIEHALLVSHDPACIHGAKWRSVRAR